MQAAERTVLHVDGERAAASADRLVVEAPLELRLDDVPIAVVMRTPGHDADLALGFALTEGILIGPAELAAVARIGDEDDARLSLRLSPGVQVDPERFRRNLYTTSSCGVCGKASIDAVRVAARQPPPGPAVQNHILTSLPEAMQARQDTFAATGGLHAAALFDPDGSLVAVREDVGRHNAVDKVIGVVAAADWPIGERILLVSGRTSFEIVQKAAVAGIPFVAAVSAATDLAVDLAGELGLTLVGFLRGDSFNVYTGGQRLR